MSEPQSTAHLLTNPIIETDREGNIIYLNRAADETFPDLRSNLQHPILAGLALMSHSGETAIFVREVAVDNRVFEQTIHHLVTSGLIRSYIVEITQRKRVEKALQQTTMLQRAILNSANYMIISTRLDGTILTFNAAAERRLRYPSAEIVGKTTPIIFHDEQEIAQRAQELSQMLDTSILPGFEALCAIARRGQIDEREWTFICKDGSSFPVLLSMTALYDAEGKLSGFLGIANNITQRKRAEELLKQAHKDLEIKVRERTAELARINLFLKAEIAERERTAKELLLLQTIAQAITEAPNFEAAIAVTLTKVCETIGWNFAEAWIPDPQQKVLKLSPAWCNPDQCSWNNVSDLLPFREASEKYTFPVNTGIPGRVWATKQPEWDQDVSAQSEDVFLRAKIAQEVGLKAALGVPIIANEEVIAVGVFFSYNAFQEDKRLVKLVQTVTAHLGLFIERKRAEDALRSSIATNRALLVAMPDTLFRINREGIFVNFKASTEQELPIASREILGKHVNEVFPEKVANQTLNCVKQALTTGKVQVLECQLPVEHEIRDYEVRVAVTVENEVMAIFRDITKRKRSEAKRMQRERQLRAILNNIPDMAWLKDQDSRYLAVNESFGKVCGISTEELLAKTDHDIWTAELAEKYRQDDLEVMQSGKRRLIEEQLVDKDGNTLWIETVKTPIFDESNQVIGTTGIAHNITERKQTEENIRNALEKEKQLGELKTRFVSMASHEFRTPLATILSSSELLENYSHQWNEEKKNKHFQRIQTAIKQMTGLLEDVLLVGKAEAGKLEFKPAPLDLKQFCEEVVEELQLTTSSHKIVASFPEPCPTACLDKKLLRHILTNLLSNAIKYSPQGDRVQFDVICKADLAVIRVHDFGIGIPPEDQARLFDTFHRANNVGTISGTGLGLAIVKKAVDCHGGEIAVESEIGFGTTFTVTLPYAVVN